MQEKEYRFEGVSYTPAKVAKMTADEWVGKMKGGVLFIADKHEEGKLRAMHAEATAIVNPAKEPAKKVNERG